LPPIEKLKIVICGGDEREIELYRIFKNWGMNVKMIGFDKSYQVNYSDNIELNTIKEIDVLILPIWGINENGKVAAKLGDGRNPFFSLDENIPYIHIAPFILNFQENFLLVLAGNVPPSLNSMLPQSVKTVETSIDEEFMQLNAIPTAEGAIKKAIESSSITLHDSKCLVLGMGRCGISLSLRLKALGAKVLGVARRAETRALACNLNLETVLFEKFEEYLQGTDFIFNTIPEIILSANNLKLIRKETPIIDIAPGGIEIDVAQKLNLNVCSLPGLPGKIAPKTAGTILARVYPRLIKSNYPENWFGGE